jgi:hypothetical protein
MNQSINQIKSNQSINQSRIHSLILSCVNSFSSLLPLAFMSFICNLTSHVLTTAILLHFKDIPIGHWFLMVIAPPKLPPRHGRALLVCMSTWSLSGSMFNPRIWIIDFIRSIPKRIRWIRCSQTVQVWFIIPDQNGKLKKSFRQLASLFTSERMVITCYNLIFGLWKSLTKSLNPQSFGSWSQILLAKSPRLAPEDRHRTPFWASSGAQRSSQVLQPWPEDPTDLPSGYD